MIEPVEREIHKSTNKVNNWTLHDGCKTTTSLDQTKYTWQLDLTLFGHVATWLESQNLVQTSHQTQWNQHKGEIAKLKDIVAIEACQGKLWHAFILSHNGDAHATVCIHIPDIFKIFAKFFLFITHYVLAVQVSISVHLLLPGLLVLMLKVSGSLSLWTWLSVLALYLLLSAFRSLCCSLDLPWFWISGSLAPLVGCGCGTECCGWQVRTVSGMVGRGEHYSTCILLQLVPEYIFLIIEL